MRRRRARTLCGLVLAGIALTTMSGCIVITRSGGTAPGNDIPPVAKDATSAAPTRAEITAAVKAIVKQNSADVVIASVEDIKTVKDAKGVWWVGATAVPADGSHFDRVAVYIQREKGAWRLFDLGTDIEATDLPPAVRSIAR
jgi:hypothetical protein